MVYECEVSRQKSSKNEGDVSSEAMYLARFMVWAYDEVNENLKDDVLKSAIKAILYYMSRRYGVNPAESQALTGVEPS
ncbi:hypothetical protein BXY53_2369 [Dichotomicrobium thermohalophilum]|uniref:Uncharacterized protein n=1 Tax=Dichotomicrobium thermohalophilum TaxID=933063 RepID=A0A397PPW1_9HYPH|nr:hypothetical protein BXY53_2369 [Dichotomicrobium thermohalophilum]